MCGGCQVKSSQANRSISGRSVQVIRRVASKSTQATVRCAWVAMPARGALCRPPSRSWRCGACAAAPCAFSACPPSVRMSLCRRRAAPPSSSHALACAAWRYTPAATLGWSRSPHARPTRQHAASAVWRSSLATTAALVTSAPPAPSLPSRASPAASPPRAPVRDQRPIISCQVAIMSSHGVAVEW
jgi:hypothetical protein